MMTPNNFTSQFSKLSLPLHGVRLPSFTIENEHKRQAGVSEDVDNYDFLKALALTGLRELGVKKNSKLHKQYVERAQHELDTLKELGFTDYVLLVWDVINYCKQEKIPTGQGRGSAAGSLILFLIGVTGIDPIRYGLYFERFV